MKLRVGPVLLFVIGTVVAELGAFGGYLAYVKPAQGPWLVVAGLLLALLGVVSTLVDGDPEPVRQAPRLHTHGPLAASPEMLAQERRDRREARRHDHRAVPAIAALLVLPLVMALGVTPSPLGAFTAGRAGATVPALLAHRDYPPLPAGDPVPLQVHDYADRAAWDGGRTLVSRTVTLVGFATPNGDSGWYLTRIVITCCAADSVSYLVAVDGGGRPPVANSWVQVTGTWVSSPPSSNSGPTAAIAATSVTRVSAPAETYELP